MKERRERARASTRASIAAQALYVDCIGGASGNMLLGAMIDAGVDAVALERELHRLPLPHWTLAVKPVQRQGIAAVHVEVECAPEDVARHLPEIVHVIEGSGLPEAVRRNSRMVFQTLAEAEAKVHRIAVDQVHFHEVGAVDAIVDIVGVTLALHMLGVGTLHVGPLPVGTGPIQCAHGTMPNPAPATAELLRGVPLRFSNIAGELVTPTGAALLVTLGTFGVESPPVVLRRIGYGAGSRDSDQVPNVTRVLIGEAMPGTDSVVQIDTNLDDMNPQVFEFLMQRLFDDGALDVYMTQIVMKKSRPATMLSVLCRIGDERKLAEVILGETTTLGVRLQTLQRIIAPREIRVVESSLGRVRVKVAQRNGGGLRIQPEYDDCRRIAQERGMPLVSVMDQVRAEAVRQMEDGSHSGNRGTSAPASSG